MFLSEDNYFPVSPKNRPAFLGGGVPAMRASYDLDDDDMEEPADDFPFENDMPGEDFDDDFDEDFEDEFDEDYEDMDKFDDDDEELAEEEEEVLPEDEDFDDVDGDTTFLPEGTDLKIADIATEDEIEEDDPEAVFEDFEEEDDEEFDEYDN